jgi:septum formation inhibitor-activating ATPase MinD
VTVKSPSKFWIVFEVVWVIEEKFVMEAYLGGKLLGEIWMLGMNQYNVVNRISQDEFDKMMEEYNDEHGYYPDT